MTPELTPAASRQALGAPIEVRRCHTLEEFHACVELQKRVWGGADIDVVPLPLFVVAAETGGQVLAAFAGTAEPENIVGFTLALPAVRQGKPYLHSHMTAVREDWRDCGVGRQLKLLQRQDALARGIALVEWTFDPLELKNAYFNLVRLGAIVRRYLPNCYGLTTSPLHGGMPTDRLMAEWWLCSSRVIAALGEPVSALDRAGTQHAASVAGHADKSVLRVHVPAEMDELRRSDQQRALRVQGEVREQFQHWFARGYAATGLERTSGGGSYLLEPWTG